MEILSHTGIPVELPTDQGAVFVGKVSSELCRFLNIKHITTTAHHPESKVLWRGGILTLRVCCGNWRAD